VWDTSAQNRAARSAHPRLHPQDWQVPCRQDQEIHRVLAAARRGRSTADDTCRCDSDISLIYIRAQLATPLGHRIVELCGGGRLGGGRRFAGKHGALDNL